MHRVISDLKRLKRSSVAIKTRWMILLAICTCTYSMFSQSNFVLGYEEGYKDTYCYYYEWSRCNSLNIPLAPIPVDGESADNFADGFNRGIDDALEVFYEEQNKVKFKKNLIPGKWLYIPDYEKLLNSKSGLNIYSSDRETFRRQVREAFYFSFRNQSSSASLKLRSALQTNQSTPEVFALLGFNFYKTGDYSNAIANLEVALKDEVDKKEDVKLLLKSSEYLLREQKSYERKSRSSQRKNHRKYRSRTYIYPDRNLGFGLRGGVYLEEDYSLLGGLHVSFPFGRRMSMLVDFEYFTRKFVYDTEYYYHESEIDFLQSNLLLRNRLVNRLELIYGAGIAFETKTYKDEFYYGIGGLQFFMSEKWFIDARVNYSLQEDEFFIETSPLDFRFTIGIQF